MPDSSRPLPRLRSALVTAAVGALLLAVTPAPAQAADTFVQTFQTVDSTFVGCTGVVIRSIGDANGVTYGYGGQPLTFPTATLRWDARGELRLTATARPGYVLSSAASTLAAPDSCYTELTKEDQPPSPDGGWCTSDPRPSTSQTFSGPDDTTVRWRVVRGRAGRTVDSGSRTYDRLLLDAVDVPLRRSLPVGRYTVEFRNAASSPDLFPRTREIEKYRCVTTRTTKGKVVFSAPRGGPSAYLVLYGIGDDPETPDVDSVAAGGSTTIRLPKGEDFAWEAYPLGNHVGLMGAGDVTIP